MSLPNFFSAMKRNIFIKKAFFIKQFSFIIVGTKKKTKNLEKTINHRFPKKIGLFNQSQDIPKMR